MAGRSLKQVAHVEARDLVERINRLVAEGDVRRITLRQGSRVLLDVPLKRGVGAGVATALIDHAEAVMGIADAMGRYTLDIEREGDGADDATVEEKPLHAHIVPESTAHRG